MARKRNGRKKLEPTEYSIWVQFPATDGGAIADYTLDLSQIASNVNRRFYRQGLQWAVSGFKVASVGDAQITIAKLPNTWVFNNAWTKGFRIWQEEQKKVYENSPSARPKYEDFKIFADTIHHDAGVVANVQPVDLNGTPYKLGKWNTSRFHIPNSVTQGTTSDVDIIGIGASWPGISPVTGRNAVSLIEGYASSRALPSTQNPETPDDMADARPSGTPENFYATLQSSNTEQMDDILTGVINDNDQPPYPYENGDIPFSSPAATYGDTQYPGGANNAPTLQIHDVSLITSTTIGGITNVKGGMFNCGLIRIKHQNNAAIANQLLMEIQLVPGDHKGYACRPMLEV